MLPARRGQHPGHQPGRDPGLDDQRAQHSGRLVPGRSTNCYPGDAYVDIIGIDNYDHFP
jgi:hypothetical protein